MFAEAISVVGGTLYGYSVNFGSWAVRLNIGERVFGPGQSASDPSKNAKQVLNRHKVSSLLAFTSLHVV